MRMDIFNDRFGVYSDCIPAGSVSKTQDFINLLKKYPGETWKMDSPTLGDR